MPSLNVSELRACLLDLSAPVAKRTHCAFYLRTLASGDNAAADDADKGVADEAMFAIVDALQQREDSALMRHELAYILGQMQNKKACEVLSGILRDESDDVLVRHESAEALGAIGDESSLDVITEFCNHEISDISETCQIARDLILWRKSVAAGAEASSRGQYLSVDPAPPLAPGSKTVDELTDILLDTKQSLFHRYRAMFSLRDMNTDEAALALVRGFKDSSALFRHEVAYVLGQMQRTCTVPGLAEVLRDTAEHRMVRHEAAESLGSIGGAEAEEVLHGFRDDEELIVHQSCSVALDTMDYWNSPEFAVTRSEEGATGENDVAPPTAPIKYL